DRIADQNQNIDRVRHRGVEVSVDYQPWTWVDVYANFTYDNTEIRRYTANSAVDGKRLPITPEYRGTAGMNFFLPVPWFDGT
ncbi:MAG: TonB-dependent receptor, partial [Myxococcota bacterium]|nr:TonB-dependent receptor [Myxococcota bacterium]